MTGVIDPVVSYLRDNDSFLIASHISPDGDALGSSLALYIALKSIKKNVYLFEKDPVPDFYRFIPGWEAFNHNLPDTKDYSLVLLDCNEPDRAGLENMSFRRSIVVDHHQTERDFGDIKWIDPNASATGLMVFKIIKALGIEVAKDIAVNLYTAISVDTGTFRYNNTTPEVLRAAAELLEYGADPAFVSSGIYDSWTLPRLRLLSLTLNTLEVHGDKAIMTVTEDMYKTTGAEASDTENFANYPRMVKDINASIVFRELPKGAGYKASLRSKADVDVAHIAELFGGGGHKNAAGFKTTMDIESAKDALLKAMKPITE